MTLSNDLKKLAEIASDDNQCYCPDGSDESWNCRACFASGVLSELGSIAWEGVNELSKENSDYVK